MRRRNDPWDKPWVTIAAVVGIIAVVIVALVFFMGGWNSGGSNAAGQSPSSPVTQASSGSSASLATGIKAESIKEQPTATVPAIGAFVHVNYIGSFSGTYGMNGEMEAVRDSGDRVYPLNATTGAVSATFRKEDGSSRHDIVVEIYKDGKALKFAKNTSAYGVVSINAQV